MECKGGRERRQKVDRRKQERFLEMSPSPKRPFQNPTLLLMKTLERLGVEETSLSIIKAVYDKHTAVTE